MVANERESRVALLDFTQCRGGPIPTGPVPESARTVEAQCGIVILGLKGVLWEHQGEAPWVFLTLPVEDAGLIREMVPHKSGFGSIRVEVTLGDSNWKTSIFPDKDSGSYVLPVKRSVREAERVRPGDSVEVQVVVVDG